VRTACPNHVALRLVEADERRPQSGLTTLTGGWGGWHSSARTRSKDMGIARAVDPLMLAILENLKEEGKGRDGRPRNVTGLEGKAAVNALASSGVELASESDPWISEWGGVELGLGSTVVFVHGF
jgi:hypothetical protein